MRYPEFELGAQRLIPALPERDPELGEIRWDKWEHALCLTHIPVDCETCDYPGPLRNAQGKTLYQDPPRRPQLKRSRVAEGQRPVYGAPVTPEPRWLYTHWASRCPHCDEMSVWRVRGWVRIHYHPYTTERAVSPQEGTLF
ncbi:hypothetical protein [Streptomyces sp. NPDC059278]|uniref:hypothetical protein n=1 Tax=Streptomyces sp. NPDC059278 TaxID=3346801 RepID=UPI003699575E